MDERKVILGSVIMTIMVTTSFAQLMCDEMVNLSVADDGRRIQVNTTGRLCLQCLNANEMTDVNTVWGLRDGANTDSTSPQTEWEYTDGVLVLLPGVVGNGSAGEYGPLSCTSIRLTPGYNFIDMTIFSSVLVPPILSAVSIMRRVLEGSGPVSLICNNPNSPEVSNALRWYRIGDNETTLSSLNLSSSSRLIFSHPILRNSSGRYDCQVMSLINRETATATANLIVEYPPVITSSIDDADSLILNANLSLTCYYNAVPMPLVQWFLNDTLLDTTDSRILVTLTNESSQLKIVGIAHNERGSYSCRFENHRGSTTVNVTTLQILAPPDPAVNLEVVLTGITKIVVSWIVGFDGHRPIIDTIVSYSVEGQRAQHNMSINGSKPMAIIENLVPAMTYTITIFLRNEVGISDPTSVQATTSSSDLLTTTDFCTDNDSLIITLSSLVGILAVIIFTIAIFISVYWIKNKTKKPIKKTDTSFAEVNQELNIMTEHSTTIESVTGDYDVMDRDSTDINKIKANDGSTSRSQRSNCIYETVDGDTTTMETVNKETTKVEDINTTQNEAYGSRLVMVKKKVPGRNLETVHLKTRITELEAEICDLQGQLLRRNAVIGDSCNRATPLTGNCQAVILEGTKQ